MSWHRLQSTWCRCTWTHSPWRSTSSSLYSSTRCCCRTPSTSLASLSPIFLSFSKQVGPRMGPYCHYCYCYCSTEGGGGLAILYMLCGPVEDESSRGGEFTDPVHVLVDWCASISHCHNLSRCHRRPLYVQITKQLFDIPGYVEYHTSMEEVFTPFGSSA